MVVVVVVVVVASEGVSLVYDHLPSHIYQLCCMYPGVS